MSFLIQLGNNTLGNIQNVQRGRNIFIEQIGKELHNSNRKEEYIEE